MLAISEPVFIRVTVASTHTRHLVPVHLLIDVVERKDGLTVLTFETDRVTKHLIVEEKLEDVERLLRVV